MTKLFPARLRNLTHARRDTIQLPSTCSVAYLELLSSQGAKMIINRSIRNKRIFFCAAFWKHKMLKTDWVIVQIHGGKQLQNQSCWGWKGWRSLSLCSKWGCLQQAMPHWVFEHCRGQRLHSFSGKPVPLFGHSSQQKSFNYVWMVSPVFQFCASGLVSVSQRGVLLCLLHSTPPGIFWCFFWFFSSLMLASLLPSEAYNPDVLALSHWQGSEALVLWGRPPATAQRQLCYGASTSRSSTLKRLHAVWGGTWRPQTKDGAWTSGRFRTHPAPLTEPHPVGVGNGEPNQGCRNGNEHTHRLAQGTRPPHVRHFRHLRAQGALCGEVGTAFHCVL